MLLFPQHRAWTTVDCTIENTNYFWFSHFHTSEREVSPTPILNFPFVKEGPSEDLYRSLYMSCDIGELDYGDK